ncbi:TetR/AcrR family transcriptional regulator [Marivivens donghaensis]|uniref:TetR/AcrR family transcriptional regulator n=1 Tax=Marivivens donghaensis TaxID=1699413 RepID=A0ABX0VVR5_9RHOB|nr:TetR/AcrR family transcriptional regulator [Marivivens donghaensis]NIY72179.1 TetR/AcrR family transcriptional regulator [Marivivens donghaensis]
MTQSPRRKSIGSQRNPETIAAVRAAAEAVLEQKGLAGFTIEAVAKEARAGKPTIYRGWGGRAGLLLDIYQSRKPADLHPDTGSVRSDIAAFLVNLMDSWEGTSAGPIFRSIVVEAQQTAASRNALDGYFVEVIAETEAMLSRGAASGEICKDANLPQAAEMLLSITVQRLLSGRSLGVKDAGLMADMILSGIAPQTNGSSS